MDQITKRIETAKKQAVRQRNYRRARDRALVRLANDYPNVYMTYLEEEKKRDEQEGKSWTDITGNRRASSPVRSARRNGKARSRR